MNIKKRKGFSLVESIISFALIIIAGLIILNIFPSSKKGLLASENRYIATVYAKGIIDDLRRSGFDNIVASTGTYNHSGINDGKPIQWSFNYTVNVTNINSSQKDVWINVSWYERNANRTVTLESIITK
jgi:type II secretory pathway pseudopilin PulG